MNNDNIRISDRPPDEEKTEHQRAVGPRFYKTRRPDNNAEIDLYHCDAMQVSTDQLREDNEDGPLAAAFISLSMIFGNGGLYSSMTPEQAEGLAADLQDAAKTIRKLLEKEEIE